MYDGIKIGNSVKAYVLLPITNFLQSETANSVETECNALRFLVFDTGIFDYGASFTLIMLFI